MIQKNDKYRLSLYETFAEYAKKEGLKWVVAHGSEGFPVTIGRDLDVLCLDAENIDLAVKLFKEASKANPQTKWIVDPHPIWGRRVLAISENYEVAELHILYKLNSGMLDCKINWNHISDDIFPHCKDVSYFKSVLMPLLGGDAKTERFTDEDKRRFSGFVKRLYRKNCKKQKISIFDKLLVYMQLGGGNVCRMMRNVSFSRKVTQETVNAATTPVVLLDEKQLPAIFECMDEMFLKFVNGDSLKKSEIRYQQSRQRLVYLTKERMDVMPDLDIRGISEGILETIANAFERFNKEKQDTYETFYRNMLKNAGLK